MPAPLSAIRTPRPHPDRILRPIPHILAFLVLSLPLLVRAAPPPPSATPPMPNTARQTSTTALAGCTHGVVLSIVAHPDDDLLFMNPDQDDAIRQGRCVHTAYLTAGDRGQGLDYALARERGIQAAYATMAGTPDAWDTDGLKVGSHTLIRHRLHAKPGIQLIMLRLPDPWLGAGWGSLTPLSRVESVPHARVRSYAPYPDIYTRSELIQLLADLIRQEHPQDIRLMDPTITIPTDRCAGAAPDTTTPTTSPAPAWSWPPWHSFRARIPTPPT